MPSPPRTSAGSSPGIAIPPVAVAAVAGGVAISWLLAGRTGPPPAAALRTELLWSLAVAYAPAAIWLIAACGLGRLARPLIPALATRSEGHLVSLTVGVAILMAVDSLLGRIGLLTTAGGAVAWSVTATLALVAAWPRRRSAEPTGVDAPRLPWWAGLGLAPALGTMLIASLAAPGWLWSSEFGGYDSLSYHLLLPREWFELGAMAPLAHNAYSGLPSHVEASTLHLMALVRDPLHAALPAQALQACLAGLAAAILATTAKRLFGLAAAILAAGVFIGTPWTVVTGSLAYNEATVAAMFAAGLAVVLPMRPTPPAEHEQIRRVAITVGILAAGAVAAKATSIALVALPLGLVAMAGAPRGRRLVVGGFAAMAALPLLLPWLVHNTAEFGQPFFPLLAGTLGGGGWSEAQIEVFRAAHGPPPGVGLVGRATAVFDELLRHGLGENPLPGEPWRPWWGLLWPLGVVAAIVAMRRPDRRLAIALPLCGAVMLMLGFWLAFTHLESRFLAPAAVPLALLLAAAWSSAEAKGSPRGGVGAAVLVVAVWGLLPAAILLRERPLGEGADRVGAPAAATGQIEAVSGRLHRRLLRDPGLDRDAKSELLATAPIWTFVNDPTLTGRDGRVLLVGESRAFYLDRPGEYASVWNRGRLSELVRADPGDPEAWRRRLREAGFTLVVLDESMIDRWRRDGWWDEQLDAGTIDAFRGELVPLRRFSSGVELLEIPDRPPRNPPRETSP